MEPKIINQEVETSTLIFFDDGSTKLTKIVNYYQGNQKKFPSLVYEKVEYRNKNGKIDKKNHSPSPKTFVSMMMNQ